MEYDLLQKADRCMCYFLHGVNTKRKDTAAIFSRVMVGHALT